MARFREPVIVLGLGRFGSALALELERQGTEVLAVDCQASIVQGLAGQLSQVVTADTTDSDALKEIGARSFKRAVVAIGTDREASILTTALVSDLGIDKIWAKALNAQHASILRRVGAHHVVLPEHEMGERVAHLVAGSLLDYVELDRGWAFAKARPPKDVVGVPLGESRLRSRVKVTVVSVKPEGATSWRHASLDTLLGYGDEIVVAGPPEDVERFLEET